uniref:RNA-directed DNA polymerase, eukaryota n=1 Tax=Tanacetum cinerariifolium TaxID=118510 RepID=A0A6L2JEA6_TANCI|nr:RNA-directed DNA polymerase, eukaryota [Tanacetum cinerariifolium]
MNNSGDPNQIQPDPPVKIVKSGRLKLREIFRYLLPKGDVQTRWVKVVPIKIIVFAWRARLDKLPTRLNLSLRGVEISSIMCPLCNSSVESASHLFFTCHVARLIWKKVLKWWDLDENMIDSYDDWLLLLKNIRLPKRLKDLFEDVCYVKWWLIWRIRNQVLFGDKHPPRDTLFDDLVNISFQWCSNCCNSKLNRPLKKTYVNNNLGNITMIRKPCFPSSFAAGLGSSSASGFASSFAAGFASSFGGFGVSFGGGATFN